MEGAIFCTQNFCLSVRIGMGTSVWVLSNHANLVYFTLLQVILLTDQSEKTHPRQAKPCCHVTNKKTVNKSTKKVEYR